MIGNRTQRCAEQPSVLHDLTTKRGQIAGQIERCDLEIRRLRAELAHIDAAILVFNPAVDIRAIRPKPVPPPEAAARGEVTRIVFDTLREVEGAVTPRDMALLLLRERGANPNDHPELTDLLTKRIAACLRANRKRGLVRARPTIGNHQGWEVVQ